MAVSPLTLGSCSLFANASTELLQEVAQHMSFHELRKREVLQREQLLFDGLGVVVHGVLQAMDLTSDGREAALLAVSAPDAFGHPSVLAQQPVELRWVAMQNATTVALLPRARAIWLLDQPGIAACAARMLAQQVSDLLDMQKLQAIHSVNARVCAWLHRQCLRGTLLRLPTHGDLAVQLNTTRESVTRLLQRLHGDGVMRREGEFWQVLQPGVLHEWARGERKP